MYILYSLYIFVNYALKNRAKLPYVYYRNTMYKQVRDDINKLLLLLLLFLGIIIYYQVFNIRLFSQEVTTVEKRVLIIKM